MWWGPCGSARRNYAMKRTEEHWELRTCRPITDRHIGQVSTKYRPSIGEVSAKCRWKVGEVSVNEKLYRPRHIWNDYRPCLDRVSTHYRLTIDRYIDRLSTECRPTVDRVSTDYRPSVDQLSTECRPLYWPLYQPISQSTLPTVNKIQHVDLYFKQLLHLIPLKVYVHPLLQSQWKFYRVGDRGQIILSEDCEHSFLQ